MDNADDELSDKEIEQMVRRHLVLDKKIRKVLHGQPLEDIGPVVAQLAIEVAMRSGMSKEFFISMVIGYWSLFPLDEQEEVLH